MISDGSGGLISSWYDSRSGHAGIYSQRVSSAGSIQWTSNGVAISVLGTGQSYVNQVADGSGGAIMAWSGDRNSDGNDEIYAQRVNSSGVAQWTTNGILVASTDSSISFDVDMVAPSSDGGAYIDMYYFDFGTSTGDLYLKKVNSDGTMTWPADGTAVVATTGDQFDSAILNSSGNIFIFWVDQRSGVNRETYGQHFTKAFQVRNVSSGVDVQKTTGQSLLDGSSNGSTSSSLAVNILNSSNSVYIAQDTVNFTQDRNWSTTSLASDLATGKTLIRSLASADGAATTYTAYIPKNTGDDGVYNCPNATQLSEISTSCSGGSFTTGSGNYTTTTISGHTYWVASSVSGNTLAYSVNSSNLATPTPSSSTTSSAITLNSFGLVSPVNFGSTIYHYPSFVFSQATNYQDVNHYQIVLKDTSGHERVYVDNIMPTSQPPSTVIKQTSDYTLIYDGYNISVTSKKLQDYLPDSGYIWKVVAIDVNGNHINSEERVILINVHSANFSNRSFPLKVTKIKNMNSNSPVLVGITLAGSNITAILTKKDLTTNTIKTQSFTGISDASSNFNIPLVNLKDGNYIVTLSATNGQDIVTLPDFPLGILGAQTTVASTTIFPIETTLLPTPVASPVSTTTLENPGENRSSFVRGIVFQKAVPLLPILILLFPFVLTFVSLAVSSGSFITPFREPLKRIFQAFGIYPKTTPKGIVLESVTRKPIPFALITINKISGEKVIGTLVSDVKGVYRSIQLGFGEYKINAAHSDYSFPTQIAPAIKVDMHEFYRGEVISVNNRNSEEIFVIPMDAKTNKKTVIEFKTNALLIFHALNRWIQRLFLPAAIISFVITYFYPNALNLIVTFGYIVTIIWKIYESISKPLLKVKLVTIDGEPLSSVLVNFIESATNHTRALLLSDDSGSINIRLKPESYVLVSSKQGYRIKDSQDPTAAFIAHSKNELFTIRFEEIERPT